MAEANVVYSTSHTHAGTVPSSAFRHRIRPLTQAPFSLVSFPLRTPRDSPSRNLFRVCAKGASTVVKPRKKGPNTQNDLIFSDGSEAMEEGRLVCPGCGVFMQDLNANLPGYYKKKATKENGVSDELDSQIDDFEDVFEEEDDVVNSSSDFDEEGVVALDEDLETEGLSAEDDGDDEVEGETKDMWTESDWESDWDLDDDDDNDKKELDGFEPPGVGYGNITEEVLKKQTREKLSKAERKKRAREARRAILADTSTVCARCHSLRNYGQVKNPNVDNLIPDFDFDRLISTRLMKPMSTAPVVVMVVDCVDFDGSFPKRAVKSLFKVLDGNKKDGKKSLLPKLVLVATKVDLLPSQVSPTRLDRWVRHRAKALGAPRLSGVYLVSAHKDLGVRNLLSFIKELAGPRGNIWVVGAQNAGKSTLINAFAKKEGSKVTRLTEAAVPGTTLGIVRIGGVLPAKAKMYDTPGLLHPYLLSMRLNREEQKMVEIRKELQPSTYRVKAGQTIYVGGLARLDVIQSTVDTIYITVWASPNVSLHLGKTMTADEIWSNHVGIRLQPPISQDGATELDQFGQREIKVSGNSWEVNSLDVSIAGLGWFSFGLKGEATVLLWTYNEVEITQREPLVIDRAHFLERPGFLLPKAISDAIGNQSKLQAEARRLKEQREDAVFGAGV